MAEFLGPRVPLPADRTIQTVNNHEDNSIVLSFVALAKSLLDDEWSLARKEHPLRAQLRACEEFLAYGGSIASIEENTDLLTLVARAVLDGRRLAGATQGSQKALTLGNDRGIGSTTKERSFKSVLQKTNH